MNPAPAQKTQAMQDTVAVLCAGPSLSASWSAYRERSTYQETSRIKATVAVNLAMKIHLADWWMCMDPMGFGLDTTWPRVGCCGWTRLIMDPRHANLLNGKPPLPSGLRLDHCVESIRDWYTGKGSAANWSTTAALCFAVLRLKAARIVIFGNDLSGDTHCDGSKMHPDDLRDDRFYRERMDQRHVIEWLQEQGTKIEHIAG